MKNKLKNIAALTMGVMISFILAEFILRIYNPFGFRQKGDQIVLQPNAKYTIHNDQFVKLDSVIVHTKNSIGFRGPEKPADWENLISIITVGGSTTECYYLSDGRDWSSLLGEKLEQYNKNVWVNNAGLDGHSTFGHSILLKDYVAAIHPDYVTFLVGCNDVGREDLNEAGGNMSDPQNTGWKSYLKNNSAVISLLLNLHRNYKAKSRSLEHSPVDISTCEILDSLDNEKIRETVDYHKRGFSKSYENRLNNLVEICRKNNIVPILITQPALVGTGKDDVTNVDLEKIKMWNRLGGKAYWLILEAYNDVTRKVARDQGILLIDLARKMPKSSRYYYDCEHFTNEGSEVVAQIICDELKAYVQ